VQKRKGDDAMSPPEVRSSNVAHRRPWKFNNWNTLKLQARQSELMFLFSLSGLNIFAKAERNSASLDLSSAADNLKDRNRMSFYIRLSLGS
jgi:hypothetical protein